VIVDEDRPITLEDIQPALDVNGLVGPTRLGMELLLDLDNAMGRLDYPFFVTDVLGHDFPEIWDPKVQERLSLTGEIFKDWVMTRKTQKVFRKVMFVNPRGTCKSAGTTIPIAPYAHLWDSELASIIMSAEKEKMADKFTDTIRSAWAAESPSSRLVDLYGRFEPTNIRRRAWSKDKMVTARREHTAHADPTLAGFSVAQGPTSAHVNLLVLDDPVTEELMERDSRWLEKVWGAYNRLPFVLDNDALLVLIMTRYDDADLIGRIITEEIEPLVKAQYGGELPADWDTDQGWIKYARLAGWEVFYDAVYENYSNETKQGDEVYKVIWPHERIADVRTTPRGESLFWLQLMQKPSAREDAPITQRMIENLYVETISDVPRSALRTIDIHCDFSFKDAKAYKEQRGDWGVAHVCAKEGGYVYRIGGFRGKLMQPDFGKKLIDLMAWVQMELHSRVRYITYEQTTGHGSGDESTRLWLNQLFMANPEIRRATPFPIKRNTQGNKSKLQRIMDTNWAWQEAYVVLVQEAPNNYQLTYQMLKQGYTKFDDDADAFADAFHEGVYKRTRSGDLPDEVLAHMPGQRNSEPLPPVFGNFDHRTGRFTPERRTARNPGSTRPTLFGRITGRD
jgi:hypothetical protein